MTEHGPIWRRRDWPSQLAGIAIQTRRGLLRLHWLTRPRGGRTPVWTVAAGGGIVGVMLAVLLFFIEDPIAAADQEEQAVHLQAEVQPTLAPLEFSRPPRLKAVLERTRLPLNWRQNDVTLRSRPNRRFAFPSHAAHSDAWQMAAASRRGPGEFVPYAQRGLSTPFPSKTLTSADVVASHDSPPGSLRTGLHLEKSLPASATAGAPLTYRITVRNGTGDDVRDVIVRERLSSLDRVAHVDPPASQSGEELVWNLGKLAASEQREIAVSLIPAQSGEIHTKTEVQGAALVAALAQVSGQDPEPAQPEPAQPDPAQPEPEDEVLPSLPLDNASQGEPPVEQPKPFPELELTVSPLGALREGETLSVTFTVANTGTAAAEDLDLNVNLSSQFQHRFGESVRHHISRLEPGESRRILLQANVSKRGDGRLEATLTMQGAEQKARELAIRVQPQGRRPVSHPPFFDAGPRAIPPPSATEALTHRRWTSRPPE